MMIRHGKSTRKKANKFGRTFDAPLDHDFISEIESTKQYLIKNYVQSKASVFSSKAMRCRQTLEYCWPEASPIVIEQFEPYHSGFFEHLRDSDVKNYWPQYYESGFKNRFANPLHGEESIISQANRILPGLGYMLAESLTQDLVLCTHCSVMNVIGYFLLGVPVSLDYVDGDFEVSEGQYIELVGQFSSWNIGSSNCPNFEYQSSPKQ